MKVNKARRGKSWLQLLAPPTSTSTPLRGLEGGGGGIRAIMAIMAIIGNTNISRHYKIMQCSLPIETWDMRTAIAIVAVKSNLELFDTCQ